MRTGRLIAAMIGLPLATGSVHAQQNYPAKSIRFIVPFPPGGANDIAARILAQPLSKALGQNVIVDNRPGGSTIIGTEIVARGPADGHTLLAAGFLFIANAALRSNLPYDTLKDFSCVARMDSTPFLLSVHPSLPVKSVKDLIALARARPGELAYASSGFGSAPHLAGEMLKHAAKIDILHVPYQTTSTVVAVLGGHASILMSSIALSLPHLASGRLRALAVTSSERSVHLKDVPNAVESGLPVDFVTTNIAMLRAGTPREIVSQLSAEIVRAVQAPEMRDSLLRQGFSPAPLNAVECDVFIRAQVQKMQRLVREASIKLE
jgi:tripartite-type tricarboxylate transporter receptor subunit TctC